MSYIVDYLYYIAIHPTISTTLLSVVFSLTANVTTKYIWLLLRKNANKTTISHTLIFIAAIISSTASFFFILNHNSYASIGIIGVFICSMILWLVFFHVFFRNFGKSITAYSGKYNRVTSEWVKKIDYIYLSVSTISIIRIVAGTIDPLSSYNTLNAAAAVLLGLAISLRITRTSIDIFGWH